MTSQLYLQHHILTMTTAHTLTSPNGPEYRCPLCQQCLVFADRTFRCLNNHSFDQAKEGYVNLLPVQHKHSKEPGDNKAMVQARRAFLDQGFYQPLADRITALYQEYGENGGRVFDAGCGEGFYTHQHSQKQAKNSVYGIDIAKNAIKMAAKRYKQCFFSVGTLSQLPFEDNFFTWIFSVYAPILEQEFTRVLDKNGYFLTVTPAENHLFELKSLIYRQANKHDTSRNPVLDLRLISEERICYQMTFEKGENIINLLAMTPFFFKTTEKLLQNLKNRTNFTCQADFLVRLYKKT